MFGNMELILELLNMEVLYVGLIFSLLFFFNLYFIVHMFH